MCSQNPGEISGFEGDSTNLLKHGKDLRLREQML